MIKTYHVNRADVSAMPMLNEYLCNLDSSVVMQLINMSLATKNYNLHDKNHSIFVFK